MNPKVMIRRPIARSRRLSWSREISRRRARRWRPARLSCARFASACPIGASAVLIAHAFLHEPVHRPTRHPSRPSRNRCAAVIGMRLHGPRLRGDTTGRRPAVSRRNTMKRTTTAAIGALSALLAFGVTGVAAAGGAAGAVYTQTNGAGGNAILAFSRSAGGHLSPLGTYPTGGLGTGSGLGSQGAVTLTADGDLLLAVDAGSDDIASVAVRDDGRLALVERVGSGGGRPLSVTAHGGIAYVLNAGGSANIAGFTLDGAGDPTPIAGSTRALSTA